MKKLLCILVALIAISAVAASVDVDVECGKGIDGWICSEGELGTEFDTVTGYINGNEAAWEKDEVGGGGGMDRSSLATYLMGDHHMFDAFETFLDFLKTVFALKSDVEVQAERIDMLEAKQENPGADNFIILLKAGLKKAHRVGHDVPVDGYTCKWNEDYCWKTE
jgi:hypothetical protein